MILAFVQVLVAGVLLYAAGTKIVAPGEHVAALRASRVVPDSLVRSVAATVVAAETGLGIAVLGLAGAALAVALGGAALLGALFTLWGTSVKMRGLTLRCGCFGGASKEVTWATPARAGLLSLIAVVGVVLSGSGNPLLPDSGYSLLSAVGIGSGVLLLTGFIRARDSLLLSGESLQRLRSLSSEVRT